MKPQFSVRLNENDKAKIQFIAIESSRTLNGQIEFLVKECIENYEKVKGKILIAHEESEDKNSYKKIAK